MKYSKALRIVAEIDSDRYTATEKMAAIKAVCQAESLDGIRKAELRKAVLWMARQDRLEPEWRRSLRKAGVL
jgi:hypothetical protein